MASVIPVGAAVYMLDIMERGTIAQVNEIGGMVAYVVQLVSNKKFAASTPEFIRVLH